MANPSSLTPFTSENAAENGAKGGAAKKGSIHLSTHIQRMMYDEDFNTFLRDAKLGYVEFKGAPYKAIIGTALRKAAAGDDKAREWLAKYGWGTKQEIQHSGEVNTGVADPKTAAAFAEFMKQQTKQ